MDWGAWWAAVHGVAKSRTRLSDFTFSFQFHELGKEMATYSSVPAWRVPGTGEPGGLLSMGSHRVGCDWSNLAAAAAAALLLLLLLSRAFLCILKVCGKYYLVTKGNEVIIHATIRINSENKLSEKSQSQETSYCMECLLVLLLRRFSCVWLCATP